MNKRLVKVISLILIVFQIGGLSSVTLAYNKQPIKEKNLNASSVLLILNIISQNLGNHLRIITDLAGFASNLADKKIPNSTNQTKDKDEINIAKSFAYMGIVSKIEFSWFGFDIIESLNKNNLVIFSFFIFAWIFAVMLRFRRWLYVLPRGAIDRIKIKKRMFNKYPH